MAYTGVLTRLPGIVPDGLQPWQASIRGLTLGEGTEYHITDWGIGGTSEVRTTDSPRAQQDGDWLGVDTYAGISRTMTVYMRAGTSTEVQTLCNELVRVWRNYLYESGVEFWIYMPGMEPLRMLGRPRRISLDKSRLLQGRITATIQFDSPYPAMFGAITTTSTGLQSTSGSGRSYDLTYDRSYTFAVTGGGVLSVPNIGTYDPICHMRVADGTIDHTLITNETTGEYLDFPYPVQPTSEQEGLVASHLARVITLNGTPARFRLAQGSSFFTFPNDEVSLIRFQNIGFATTPQMYISVAQGYLV